MTKICPYSMTGEPIECYQKECMAWNDGECSIFEREPLSSYFIAKNMKKAAEELNSISEGINDIGSML